MVTADRPGMVRVNASASEASGLPGRRRGKQPGARRYGKRRRMNLLVEEVAHDLPEAQKRCPICGKPLAVFPGIEDSEERDRRANSVLGECFARLGRTGGNAD